ncbi:MAG: hypothetical protein HXS44_03450 [Theionarchaea archaeon]|nr:hypothetical protein [Theionarchaea archaeon]
MNKYVILFFFILLLFLSSTTGEDSITNITIEPHIGESSLSVTQSYQISQEGLTTFEVLTMSLSYADLNIFDEKGALDYEIGKNIIIGRNIYRRITVFFREPTSPPYSFTVKYWFPTAVTGKPLTGKYIYKIVNVTDSTTVKFVLPLTGIKETSRSEPKADMEEREDSTVFSYRFSEDTTIILNYEPKEGIDYTDTRTETLSYQDYTFEVIYPQKTELFLEDIKFFIDYGFPVFLKETATPLRFTTLTITLDKEENTWAAAEYRGEGSIRILINNTASYPSQFLAHELIHSYIGVFPRYLEEGIADYFEGQVNRIFATPRPGNYIPNTEPFFQTYERQFDDLVDITESRYGLGLTDHQEALIYAKYSKGTFLIYEIAYSCGHETVQEILAILKEERTCDINRMIFLLTEGDTVYRILDKYGFDVVPPYAYPAEELLEEVEERSWWSNVLCFISRYETRIRAADPGNIEQVKADIERTGEIASQTILIADGVVLFFAFFIGGVALKTVHRIRRENPRKLYFAYAIPVGTALILCSYFLYEFLFSGYKFQWILGNILAPLGFGFISGVSILLLLLRYCPKEGRAKFTVDVVWTAWFFAILVVGTSFLAVGGITLVLGYVMSLLVLLVMRRREYINEQ